MKRKIIIFSTCKDDWGGSEELWARSLPYLQRGGTQITVCKNKINFRHPEFTRLSIQHIRLIETNPSLNFPQKAILKLNHASSVFLNYKTKNTAASYQGANNFYKILKQLKPDMAVISQAINFDGLIYALQCLKLKIPYIVISQKAVDFYWPNAHDRNYMAEVWQNARKCFFVSCHNLRLTEEQFGFKFHNSQIIYNPIKTKISPTTYPSVENAYHLACVGRLFILDKGQDILIRILAKAKWKSRPLHITFIGDGSDSMGLRAMANLLGVRNINFTGHQDTQDIWKDYHALIMPSRSEGLPLSITEAMAAGRMVITTNAGGNAEIVSDEVTGFIGEANENSFDDAMERAWRLRDQWKDMGMAACQYIKDNIPVLPEREFASILNNLDYE